GAHVAPVDAHAVGRAQVGDGPAVAHRAQLGVAARDVRVGQHDVALAAAPDGGAAGPHRVALALGQQHSTAAAGAARVLKLLLGAGGGRVDHRVPVVGLLHGLGRGAHEPRLDPELAQAQALVGVEGDLRAADERELLAAGVLEQVGRELVGDLVLDAFEALAILGAEPDDVL